MFSQISRSTILICLAIGPALADDQHPMRQDVTGILWSYSFDEALAKAQLENKILLLKPVAYRSKSDGTLSPSAEVWRAGPMVDERVVRLINRRFVPYYFDMDEAGAAYSKDATDLAIRSCAQLRFSAATMPTPPTLLLSADQQLLQQVDNFETPEKFLEILAELLNQVPGLEKLTYEESQLADGLEQAWVFYELRRFEAATEHIKNNHSSEAYFLRGLIARETKNWDSMVGEFAMVTDEKLKSDVSVDRAIGLWRTGDFVAVRKALESVSPKHPRYQEAMYYFGLACFHLADRPAAFQAWRDAILQNPQSAWALRLDWTLGMAELGPQHRISPIERPKSLLGRTYMSPNGNYDLDENRVFDQR